MGLKLGMAAFAANQGPRGDGGLFVPVKLNEGKPFPLAQVVFMYDGKSDVQHALRYPHGELGYLMLSRDRQLEVLFIEEFPWVPTKLQMEAITGTLPKWRIVFNGSHEVHEVLEKEPA